MKRMVIERKSDAPRSLAKRIGWLVLIWALSVLALGVVAYGFRLVMKAAGLSL
ncbi:DUF2474 domain-containing protein [Tabrizicola sp.]|uniref:DUF2474 domain-containing protein n=1 Tax=Tabrizicola sp. TaxID=2005166 RepID=UPI002FDCDED6